MNTRILGLVPARGGSKGIPKKNIVKLGEKPLIAYTIEAALKSDLIDYLMVSTEDNEIAEISRSLGANVPFMRPFDLAQDSSKSIDVVTNTIDRLSKIGEDFTHILLLQPTSPLRTYIEINEAVNTFLSNKNIKSLVSVCKLEYSKNLINHLPEDLRLDLFVPCEDKNKQRQDLKPLFRINGAIYLTEIFQLLNHKSFIFKDTFAFVMERKNSIDIDDVLDLAIAESWLKLVY
jgi:CMP-N,N'-diacetyllegionaminic acid synthase